MFFSLTVILNELLLLRPSDTRGGFLKTVLITKGEAKSHPINRINHC